VVPKVGGTVPLGAVRNSRGAMKQKWAVRGEIGDPVNNYISFVFRNGFRECGALGHLSFEVPKHM